MGGLTELSNKEWPLGQRGWQVLFGAEPKGVGNWSRDEGEGRAKDGT
jgi:hypothetical protein